MKSTIKNIIGGTEYTFEIEGKDVLQTLMLSATLGQKFDTCAICGEHELELSGSKAQGFTFVKIRCKSCGAQAKLGQYKDGGYFWNRFEKYEPKPQDDQEETRTYSEDDRVKPSSVKRAEKKDDDLSSTTDDEVPW
jgi:hypothetical protein